MRDLIDGYNLLYAMGVLPRAVRPSSLEKARLRLLGLLHGAYGAEEAVGVTVVFDGARAPPGATPVQAYKGIHVLFSSRGQEADDLIEERIDHDSAPRQLRVVSDDHRIQHAARRRHCLVAGCGAYLDWLDRHRKDRQRPQAPEQGKPATVSPAETQHWLEEFADLQNDPALEALFEIENYAAEDPDGEPPPSPKPG